LRSSASSSPRCPEILYYLGQRIDSLGRELCDEMGTMRSDLRDEMAATRSELRGGMATMGSELRDEMANLANSMRTSNGTPADPSGYSSPGMR
jgi:hypothetical protein